MGKINKKSKSSILIDKLEETLKEGKNRIEKIRKTLIK
jgi:hypothetical protein